MIISIKLSPQDERYIREYAAKRDINVSEYIRQAVIGQLEYESDFQCYRSRINTERRSEPVIYSLDKSGSLVTI